MVTSEAKNKIRNWFKKERKEENIAEGRGKYGKRAWRSLISIPENNMTSSCRCIPRRLNKAEDCAAPTALAASSCRG